MTKATVFWILRLAAKILSVALFAATIVCAYGGYFNPEWWTLPSISVLFFPYFAMATLAVSILWLLRRRIIFGAMGICALLACGPTFTAAMPLRFGNSASDPSKTFKMITFNCLHLWDSQNKEDRKAGNETNRSLDFLINSGADFICLQELLAFDEREIPRKYHSQVAELLKIYPYYSTDDWREIEFISKYPFRQIDIDLGDIHFGSCASYVFNIDGEKLTVINVHLPSYQLTAQERLIITEARSGSGVKQSIKEFEGSIYQKMEEAFAERAKISKAIAEYAEGVEGNVIVCGDFNDVPGSWTYRNFIKRGFEDAYAQTGFGHLITYNEHLMWFHIDQILYKGALVPLYVRKGHLNASDHYPLIAEFEFI